MTDTESDTRGPELVVNAPFLGMADDIESDEAEFLIADPATTAAQEALVNYGQVASTVNGGMHFHQHRIAQIRRDHELHREDLDALMATLVPRRYVWHHDRAGDISGSRATALFSAHTCLVLLGPPLSGRRTAAISLLHPLVMPVREISLDIEIMATLTIAALLHERHTAYLLRLPETKPGAYREICRQLVAHQRALRDLESVVAVVMDSQASADTVELSDEQILSVNPPDLPRLFVERVRTRSSGYDATIIAKDPLMSERMRRSNVGDTLRLADTLVETVRILDRSGADHTVDQIVRKLIEPPTRLTAEIAAWFPSHPENIVRLFIIATAMLDGAPDWLILDEARQLAGQSGARIPHIQGIEGPGLGELIAAIDGTLTSDGRLSFGRPDYADAILRFIHRDRSDEFRRNLWMWAASIPIRRRPSHVRKLVGESIAQKMFMLATSQGDTKYLRFVATEWSQQPLQQVFVDLITAIAVSNEAGASMRRRLLDWTEVGDSRILCAVASVCCGEFAVLFPYLTLTRLHRLAARTAPGLADLTVSGMLKLWMRRDLRGILLARVADWMSGGVGARYVVANQLLVRLAEADRDSQGVLTFVTEEPRHRTDLQWIIASAFESPDGSPDIQKACRIWLDLCEPHPERIDYTIDLLVSIVVVSGDTTLRLARLRYLAYGWQPLDLDSAHPVRRRIRESLMERAHLADPILTAAADDRPPPPGPSDER